MPYFLFATRHTTLNRIVGTVVTLIVVQIVLQTILAIFSRSRLTGVLAALALLWVHATLGFIDPNHAAIHFINVLFAVLVLAEMIKTVTQLVSYRVGA